MKTATRSLVTALTLTVTITGTASGQTVLDWINTLNASDAAADDQQKLATYDVAVRFQTEGNKYGYAVSSLEIDFDASGTGASDIAYVSIQRDDPATGGPREDPIVLHDANVPAYSGYFGRGTSGQSAPVAGVNTYTPRAGGFGGAATDAVYLDSNARYWLKITAAANGSTARVGQTTATNPTYPWRVNDIKLQERGSTGWSAGTGSRTIKFKLKASKLPKRTVSVEDATATEGTDAEMRFRVALSAESKAHTSVIWHTYGDTATANEDFTSTGEQQQGTVVFEPAWANGGVAETSTYVSVPILDDNEAEGNETFRLELGGSHGLFSWGVDVDDWKAIGTIVDDEGAPVTPLSATFPASRFASSTHKGPNDRPQVIVTFSEAVAGFTKSTPSISVTNGTVVQVKAHTEDGLAKAYMLWVQPSGKDDIVVNLVADAACGAGGICTDAGTLLTQVPAARTITGFAGTTPKLRMNDAAASEAAQIVAFTVRLDPAHDQTVTVDYATANATATAGADYTATSGTLSFAAWETEKTVEVPIIGDETEEPDETLTFSLANVAGGAEIERASATGTLWDDDEPSSSGLTATFENLPAEHDGETPFTFNVAFSAEVAIGYASMRDDAFTVDEGDVTQARRVDGRSDRWEITVEPDGDEDVTVTLPANRTCTTRGAICSKGDNPDQLSNSPSTSIGGPTATAVTSTPTLSIAGGSGTEGTDSSISFTVTLDEAATDTVTVDYATSDGTATAGDDYTSTSGTLTFDTGTTSKTVSVPIADDTENESDETFTLTLSNATGADVGTATAAGTIRNRTVVVETTPTVSIAGGSGTEGDDDDIDFTVTLDEAATGTVTVNYATSDGTAEAGDDYTAKSGTLSFSAGQTSSTVSVSIADDSENESDETFTVTLSNPSGADLGTATATGTIENRYVAPLTARFENMPSEHDGSEFTFELHFSENAEVPFRRLRDRSFTLVEADIPRVQRLNPQSANRNQSWTITVEPDGNEQIGITLPAAVSCNDNKSICTHDGRKLSHSTSATVAGPVGIAVGDTRVQEAAGAVLAFTVSLSRSSSSSVTVDYATSDGTATAGADYTGASGTLTIGAGSTSGQIEVTVLDDSHDDGGETMTLTLSNPTNGAITDETATGTIDNSDAMPRALMARFGRTAAVHVVEQVEERMNAPRRPGFDGRVAGRRIDRNMGRNFALDLVNRLSGGAHAGGAGAPGAPLTGMHGADAHTVDSTRTASRGPQSPIDAAMNPSGMTGLQPAGAYDSPMAGAVVSNRLLDGSSFALNRATSAGGILSLWSRSAQSRFHGREGAIALNGDVRTTMLGADYSKGRMITGVSLSHSRGLGSYAGVDQGRVTSAVTGLYPWIGYQATERVSVWTVAGYGAGGLLLSPGRGPAVETGLSMAMAAGGGRGEIIETDAGFGLAVKADSLWVGTRTDAVAGASGHLKATSAAITRIRTAIEGSKSTTIAARIALTPSIELGIRQDGGDAEVGRGVDIGLGLVLADGVSGLSADVRIRRLLVHEAAEFAESGISISVSYNPSPKTPLGFTARVSPAWGGDAMNGGDALWGRDTMSGMGPDHLLGGGGNRLDTELGYGLPIGTRFVGTPRVGVRTSEYGRDYRLGWSVEVLEQGRMNLQLGIDAERRESSVFQPQEGSRGTDQRVLGHASVQW